MNHLYKKRKTITWIHCLYDESARLDITRCYDVLSSFIPEFEISVLIVVNNPAVNLKLLDFRFNHLVGSNSMRDFSAWKEGWDSLSDSCRSSDWFFISNDTLEKVHRFSTQLAYSFAHALKNFEQSLDSDSGKVIIGASERIKSVSYDFRYVPTFFCALNRAAAEVALPDVLSNCMDASVAEEYNEGQGILQSPDRLYADFMNGWLTGGSGLRWYAASQLNAMNFNSFKVKCLCILLEHSLSYRVFCAGGKVLSCFQSPSFTGRIRRLIYVFTQRLYR